jgi:hypothetical protein
MVATNRKLSPAELREIDKIEVELIRVRGGEAAFTDPAARLAARQCARLVYAGMHGGAGGERLEKRLQELTSILPPVVPAEQRPMDLSKFSDAELAELERLHRIGTGAEPAVEREAELSRIAELEREIEGFKRKLAEARERESVAARNASAAPGPNPGNGEALSRTADVPAASSGNVVPIGESALAKGKRRR